MTYYIVYRVPLFRVIIVRKESPYINKFKVFFTKLYITLKKST